ncbi:Rhodanese-like domain-containing protein, partial [Blastocladiella britannica]
IRRITPDTLALLIDGRITGVARAIIIDVRFPYEYGGGHVRGAINVNSFEDLDTMFFGRTTSGSTKRAAAAMHDTALIFHCEFSSHRAPAMAMHLRAQDRIVNMARYPDVHFPEIYVLEGGYKRFFEEMPHRC